MVSRARKGWGSGGKLSICSVLFVQQLQLPKNVYHYQLHRPLSINQFSSLHVHLNNVRMCLSVLNVLVWCPIVSVCVRVSPPFVYPESTWSYSPVDDCHWVGKQDGRICKSNPCAGCCWFFLVSMACIVVYMHNMKNINFAIPAFPFICLKSTSHT